VAIATLEDYPKGQRGEESKQEDQEIESQLGIEGVKDCSRQPSVSNPGTAVMSKGKELRSRDKARTKDVLTCFKVKPEVGIAKGLRRKEKSECKYIHFKDLA
jgi:hypothetical protein